MLGSSILDVAIGMAFIYLLLSLIASTIQEGISAVLQSRSANLEHGIRSLFSGGKIDGHFFVDLIYKHGLIRGLYQDPKVDKPDHSDPEAAIGAPKRRMRRGIEFMRRIVGIKPSEISRDISDPYLLPPYIPARTFAMTLIDILNPDKQNGDPMENMAKKLIELCKAADEKRPNKTAEALLALLADARTAKDSAEKFRCNIENWYNDSMDRASGWYKRHTQNILLVIGLGLAILFNVDTINVAKTLWFDRDARQGLAGAATTYAAEHPLTESPAAAPSLEELKSRMETRVTAFNDVTAKYLVPVGWHYSGKIYWDLVTHPGQWRYLHIFEQFTGWLMTALALSLGAPFWFDLLNKVMVIRSTVKPSEKSRTEPSKD